ncbi:MAG TPA: GNAT family N-acetyltransferase [Thermoplasmata archaeon]|nr:GNAT family N-acetyltransferase [Thermoplasmata archaeon]
MNQRGPSPSRIVRITPALAATVVGARRLFDEPLSTQPVRRYVADPRNVLWVARVGPRTVGFARGTSMRQLHSHRLQFFLYEIAVHPSFRRMGIARALIDRMRQYCRSRGFAEAFVFTSPYNRPAVRLYRSTGGRTETVADRMFVYRFDRRPPRRSSPRGTSRRRAGTRSRPSR